MGNWTSDVLILLALFIQLTIVSIVVLEDTSLGASSQVLSILDVQYLMIVVLTIGFASFLFLNLIFETLANYSNKKKAREEE